MKKQLFGIFLVILATMLAQPAQATQFLVDNNNLPILNSYVNPYISIAETRERSAKGLVKEIVTLNTPGSGSGIEEETGAIPLSDIYSRLISLGLSSSEVLVFGLGINEKGDVLKNYVEVAALDITLTNVPLYGTVYPSITYNLGTDVNGSPNTVKAYAYSQGTTEAEVQFQLNLGFDFFDVYNAELNQTLSIHSRITNVDDGFEIYFFDAGFTADSPFDPPVPPPPIPGVTPPTGGGDPGTGGGGSTPVPEPATMFMLGLGLASLTIFGKQKIKK